MECAASSSSCSTPFSVPVSTSSGTSGSKLALRRNAQQNVVLHTFRAVKNLVTIEEQPGLFLGERLSRDQDEVFLTPSPVLYLPPVGGKEHEAAPDRRGRNVQRHERVGAAQYGGIFPFQPGDRGLVRSGYRDVVAGEVSGSHLDSTPFQLNETSASPGHRDSDT